MTEENTGDNPVTLILGVGNVALADEAFGPQVVRRLREYRFPEHVRMHDGAVAGFDLLGYLEGVERLVIVDVMKMELEPGDIGWLDLDDELKASGRIEMSFHQVGILELLQIAELIGHKPQVHFLVTRPVKVEWSFEMTPPVRQAVDKAVSYLVEKFHGLPSGDDTNT
ncbi:hydrogenase maturation protease [Dehalogenimonas lykanthroporepellens BL-DC-9]|jgi:hydrogenase maturation protease|nr:hydrogenase maturation protease [Dehalogenimonas lykanthroporepellens BL-DC-9]